MSSREGSHLRDHDEGSGYYYGCDEHSDGHDDAPLELRQRDHDESEQRSGARGARDAHELRHRAALGRGGNGEGMTEGSRHEKDGEVSLSPLSISQSR